ncbi:MAG: YhbY family RNA-binding protein [Gammaproteobacteria bacterium]|nr:YhbY family RNA-binding protein [Gammaproteobacteria bacterium]
MHKVTAKKKKQLMARAHGLHAVVMIGRHGLTAAVHAEIETALTAHELIKVKVASHDRQLRAEMFSEIAEQHQAALVHKIGLVAIFYRRHEE